MGMNILIHKFQKKNALPWHSFLKKNKASLYYALLYLIVVFRELGAFDTVEAAWRDQLADTPGNQGDDNHRNEGRRFQYRPCLHTGGGNFGEDPFENTDQ